MGLDELGLGEMGQNPHEMAEWNKMPLGLGNTAMRTNLL